jgi:hypothetical protein
MKVWVCRNSFGTVKMVASNFMTAYCWLEACYPDEEPENWGGKAYELKGSTIVEWELDKEG